MAVVVAVLLSWCVSSLLLAVPLGRAISANFSGRLIGAGRSNADRGDADRGDAPRSSFVRAARPRASAMRTRAPAGEE